MRQRRWLQLMQFHTCNLTNNSENLTARRFSIRNFWRSYTLILWGLWRCCKSILIFEHVRKIGIWRYSLLCLLVLMCIGIPHSIWWLLQQPASPPIQIFFSCIPLIIFGYNSGIFVALEYCYKWIRLHMYIKAQRKLILKGPQTTQRSKLSCGVSAVYESINETRSSEIFETAL